MRLQRFLAMCGAASRRKAERLILDGRVALNGSVVTEMGVLIDALTDRVTVNGRQVTVNRPGVLLFHKPRFVITTKEDPQGRATVADFLPQEFKSYFPVGRLDFDACGLLLLTNDGELAQHLSHPRFYAERSYEVVVRGQVEDKSIRRLERGVKLEDGVARAAVRVVRNGGKVTSLHVSVREGRNHLVKRLMEKIRHPVITLKRIAHGPIKLGKLKEGKIRKLSEEEYRRLRERVMVG